MQQTDSLKRIDMPNENNNEYVNFGNKLKPMLDFESEELKFLYFQHKEFCWSGYTNEPTCLF